MMNDLALFDRLGFNRQNGLHFFAESKWKNKFPKRVEEVIEYKLKPYAIYELNNEPFILFFENRQKPEVHKWCWNVNSSPIIIIEEENQIKIYNGFSFDNKKKLLHLLLEDDKDLDDFNYLNLVSGKFLEKYGSQFKETHRVDYNLLENIETARNILIDEHQLDPPVVNNLIGRLLFTRYLIDRGVKIGKYDYLSRRDLLKILLDRNETYELFYYLRDKFNGNLFPIDEEREAVVNESHLGVFIKLFKGDELKTGQMSLFDFYDFSVIPIEFISNIYEFFIGPESQRRKGAYYTPPFLVDYILKETVDAYFKENCDNDRCKVLDPACGSGIFLVETLRRLIHRYQALNPDCKKDKERYKEQLKNLLCKNIFGVDRDENAVNVAVFSLYITLLDYQEPKDIEDFRFPILVGSNFFVNDFFNTEADFGPKLKERNFDFIIGNPPWGNLSGEEGNNRYIEHCEKRGFKIGRKEISQAFLYRIGDFSTEYTKISLVVTSKNLYNIKPGSKFFRRYFLDNFKINQIFELSSVRRQVFIKSKAKAIAPPSIIFFQYANGQNTDDNVVKHIALKPNRLFELFNIFVIEKYDYKEVLQKHFKQYDWLFKVLVYGNILDFYFIKRLKENYSEINDTLNDENRYIYGKGAQIAGGERNDANFLLDRYYVDTKKKLLRPFYVQLREDIKWKARWVHRTRKKELYTPPMLLVKKGTTAEYKVVSAVCSEVVAFTDSITSIKAYNKDNKNILTMLSGLFNSTLFSYYFVTTGSSSGIEREQIHDAEEMFKFSYVYDKAIVLTIREIEKNREAYYRILSESKKKILDPEISRKKNTLEKEYMSLQRDLDSVIYEAFELSNQEKALVDYVQEVSIPLINRKNNKKLFKEVPEKVFEEYAQLFIDHFKKYFNGPDNYFFAEIHRAKYVVGINFVVSDNKPETSIKWIPRNDDLKVVELLSNFSFSEVSNDIFIQKDVKGFEKKSFYVIKPNQYKLWHKAIAYLDLNEFSDAILNSGRKQLLE